MVECSWIALGLFSATAATVLAAGTALFLVIYPRHVERRERQDHAAFLRAQLLSHLGGVQASLGPSDQPLASEQRQAFARIHFLGLHADLLRPEEWRALIELQGMLQRIDHKTSINKREVRALDRVLVSTCAALKAHGDTGRSETMSHSGGLRDDGTATAYDGHRVRLNRLIRKVPLPWGNPS